MTTDTRLDALEDDLRRAEASIRNLCWVLVVITLLLAIAIASLALVVTGYLPR